MTFDRLGFYLTQPDIVSWLCFASFVINISAALGMVWIMQRITCDADFCSLLGAVKWFHRGAIMLLAAALFANGVLTAYWASAPRPIDLLVEAALLVVITISAARHSFANRHEALRRMWRMRRVSKA